MQLKILAAASATLFLTAAGQAPAPDPRVDYVLTPAMADGALAGLDVEMRFQGDADGETRLALPSRWAGETEYWKGVRDLTVDGAQAREDGPGIRVLSHAPGAAITVRYRVVSAYEGDLKVGDTPGNPYRPVVRPAWFSAVGHGVFGTPEDGQDRPATFRWGARPDGWKVASDVDHQAMGARTMVGDIQQSVVIGGRDLRIATREVAGADVRVAVLGEWTFTPEQFADMAGKIIEGQRAYWREPGETFFIAVTPLIPVENSMSLGGTGLDDGFAIWGGTDMPLDSMLRLLAHEHMHTWNSRRLGMPSKTEGESYWFSEGFTDFLTNRVLLGSGLWTLEQFVGQLNSDLAEYAASPARTATNPEIVAGFWSNPNMQRLPYLRGQMLAWLWDWRLRQASGGRRDLDDVLRAQTAQMQALWAANQPTAEPELTQRFAAAYTAQGGPDLAPDYARFVQGGEVVWLPQTLFAPCARVETMVRKNFARGWDAQATTDNGNVMTGLREDSPAYRSGLRNGMQIVKREFGEVGNSTVEYGLRIKNPDGSERVYRFMPEAPGYQTSQRIVLTADMGAKQRAACVRLMGGA